MPHAFVYTGRTNASHKDQEKRGQATLEHNQTAYQWKHNDDYPPHIDVIPAEVNKSDLQIFDIEALFETTGIRSANLSREYTALAPDSKGPWTFAKLKEHNLKNRDRDDWFSDNAFAQQHFTGTNPTTITVASSSWIEQFKSAAETLGETRYVDLLNAVDASSLYIQDYSYFRTAMGLAPDAEIVSDQCKYGCAPVGLFRLEDGGRLHPLAIIIDYKGNIDDSVVIFNQRLDSDASSGDEESGWPWRYAKTCIQSADWLRHEVSIHLVHTHLVEEAVIVSAHRTLHPQHIVFELLRPHWETTLPLNNSARTTLVPGIIVPLAGAQPTQLITFMNHAYATFDWQALMIPNDLERRGFPVELLRAGDAKYKNYAYARNMVLMWDTLRAFVGSILTNYYPGGDASVAADEYIAAWCAEMRSEEGGQMGTFPEIKTLASLIDVVTMCIHIASPQHTAVNYLQHYYMVFIPNKPPALFQPLPRTASELAAYTEQDLIRALPFHNQRDWLIAAQLPYLLSFEVAQESSLLEFAHKAAENDDGVIAAAGKRLKKSLLELAEVFKAHSREMSDHELTEYMVMDPRITAASILI
ncbi:lipoxygenase [Lentinus brumalis]|uniref:Manganese lipoxygenase n=1 Tax=Lentinus brumalis TaxID=2498619 RepID=A0A371CQW3_9APHY|nr:lipoxygenase [Polyporus brumalis]